MFSHSGLELESECTPCEPGQYCPGYGNVIPAGNCSARYYCASAAATAAPTDGSTGDVCPVGYYCPSGSGQAIPCEPGTYTDTTLNEVCLQCTPGNYCITGTNPEACPAGYYCPEGQRLQSISILTWLSIILVQLKWSKAPVQLHVYLQVAGCTAVQRHTPNHRHSFNWSVKPVLQTTCFNGLFVVHHGHPWLRPKVTAVDRWRLYIGYTIQPKKHMRNCQIYLKFTKKYHNYIHSDTQFTIIDQLPLQAWN